MKTKQLRELLRQPGLIRAPGAFDACSARLIEMAGFPAVYFTGYGASASVLGKPDIGLLTMTEMVNGAKNMANAINIPLIADADNGYGGILNVIRTIQEYEQAGVAGIQIEDQVFPKRCGHMEGKELIALDDMVAKIRAAVHARRNPETVIIARTDARAVHGFDHAIERVNAYSDAGADVIFFEAPQSIDEMRAICRQIHKPLLANMVENGKTPFLTGHELETLGFKIVIYPVSALYTATKAINDMLETLKTDDSTKNHHAQMVDFPGFNKMIELDKYRALEKEFL